MLTRPMPDLNALRIFLEVAVTKSMTEAARRIGITQSAVSQAVRKLEAELGVELVQRSQRPVALTPAGAVLERRAGALLRDALQLPHAVREAATDPVQEIRLGMVDTVASTAGPELIRELTGTATRVVIWSGLAPSLGQALIARDVDAIITSDTLDDVDGLVRLPLWKEPFVLLLPRGQDTRQSLASLAQASPMVRYSARSHTGLQVERHLRRLGLAPERRIEIDGSDALVAMVAAGIGWAITTPLCLLQGAAHLAGTEAVLLPRPRFNRVLSVVCRQDGPGALARRTAAVARQVLHRTCLARLGTLLPHLAPTIEIAGDDDTQGKGDTDMTHSISRRSLLAATGAGLLAPAAGARAAEALPYGLKPGKPHAGTEVVVLLPNAAQYRAQKKRIPQFEALTGIKLTHAYIPYGQLLDKITTEAVSGSSAYDLVTYQDSWGPALKPYIDPVEAWLKRDGLSMATYPAAFARASTLEGEVYGLPVRAQAQLLYYRKDLLAAAGVQPPKTWDEVVTVGRAVQAKGDIAGIAMDYGKGNGYQNLFLWLNFLWGNGSDLLDAQGNPAFNNAGGIKATQDYVDLLLKHKVANPGSVQFNEGDMVNSVAQGKSAMCVVWTWAFPVLTGARSILTRDQVGFAEAPGFPGRKDAGLGQCMPFSISKLSKKKDAAWEALKWMANPDLEKDIATDTSDPDTAEIIVAHTDSFRDAKVNAVTGGVQETELRSLDGARNMPQLTEWPQVASVLENAISVLVTSNAAVKPTMDEAAEQVGRVLRRARRGR